MDNVRIAIVGAGLSGLYAAWRLERMGIRDYVVLEARDLAGGRIASFDAGGAERFDLGPTWFWPGYQPQLDDLVSALGLSRFLQHESGDTVLERSANAPPVRVPGYASAPESMRLAGGMQTLVEALARDLDPARVIMGIAVRRICRMEGHVALHGADANGSAHTWHAGHVLLAVAPRLAEQTIVFEPALPPALALQWRATATWMAPHAKYVAVYDEPFWRGQGLSGAARSACGPLGEIHDASTPAGSAALFGFFALPAQARRQVPEDLLRAQCRAQLARLFGARAAAPLTDAIKDWACDPNTTVDMDLSTQPSHQAAPPQAASGPWCAALTGIASEYSPQFPGYLAGAVQAAELGVQRLIARAPAQGE